jgi:hypothetical protein
MGLSFGKLIAMSSRTPSNERSFLSELPNMQVFRLLSEAISKTTQVVQKIFENLQQLRMEHTRASIRNSQIRQQNALHYKKIFESKQL